MASWHQTYGTEDLQHCHLRRERRITNDDVQSTELKTILSRETGPCCLCLGFDVLRGETLCDDINALAVTQHMSSALRAVHQSFDAADQRGVDLRVGRLVVHRLEEIQDARQAVQVDESSHKAGGDKSERHVRNVFVF